MAIFKISEFLGFFENFWFDNFSNLAIFGSSEFFYNYLFEKFLNFEFFFILTTFNPATVNKAIFSQLPIRQLFKFHNFQFFSNYNLTSFQMSDFFVLFDKLRNFSNFVVFGHFWEFLIWQVCQIGKFSVFWPFFAKISHSKRKNKIKFNVFSLKINRLEN